MQDSTSHIDASPGDTPPPTDLAERLLRRHGEPLGVIDVRQPQQSYARTAGWVAQRFALLEHWQTRYGSDGDTLAANTGLMLTTPRPPAGAPNATLSSPAQVMRAATQSMVSQPSAAATAPSAAAPPQFRVRRHTAAPMASPQMIASAADTPSSPDRRQLPTNRAGVVDPERPAAFPGQADGPLQREETLPPRAVAAPLSSANPATHIVPQAPQGAMPLPQGGPPLHYGRLALGDVRPEGESASGTTGPAMTWPDAAVSSAAIVPTPLVGRAALEPDSVREAASGVEHVSQGEGSVSPTVVADRLPSGNLVGPTSTSVPQAVTPMVIARSPLRQLQRRVGAVSPAPSRPQEATEPVVAGVAEQRSLPANGAEALRDPGSGPVARGSQTEQDTPLAAATPPAAMPLVQRQAADSGALPAAIASGVTERREPVATEVPATTSEVLRPTMVWRQTAAGASPGSGLGQGTSQTAWSPLPLAVSPLSRGERQLARQPQAGESPTSPGTENNLPPAPMPAYASPPAHAIDVGRLTRQVSRLLAHQLMIERERRGRGR
jgi:hypothetical protein